MNASSVVQAWGQALRAQRGETAQKQSIPFNPQLSCSLFTSEKPTQKTMLTFQKVEKLSSFQRKIWRIKEKDFCCLLLFESVLCLSLSTPSFYFSPISVVPPYQSAFPSLGYDENCILSKLSCLKMLVPGVPGLLRRLRDLLRLRS